jgi:hypothetical protein
MLTLLAYTVSWFLGIALAVGVSLYLRRSRPHAARGMRRATVIGAGCSIVLTGVALLAVTALAAAGADAQGRERAALTLLGDATLLVPFLGTAPWVLAMWALAGRRG